MGEAIDNGNGLFSSCLVSNILIVNSSISDCSNGVVNNEITKENELTRYVFGFSISEFSESLNSERERRKAYIPKEDNDPSIQGISTTSQVADQSILSSVMNTATPFIKTTYNIHSPSKPPRLVKNSHLQNKNQDNNNTREVNNHHSRCNNSCHIPPDHITDSRLSLYYVEYKKSEMQKLNTLQSAVKNELSQYNEFKNSLLKKEKPIAFSQYKAHLERIDVKPEPSMLRPDNENIVIKKYHGNNQVNIIHTNTNRIHSITHSFIAKYPLVSDPFDITCISVMMFIIS